MGEHGPFESEDQARMLPEVRAIYEAYDHGHGTGNLSGAPLITAACEAAGGQLEESTDESGSTPPVNAKTCSACKKTLPINDFGKRAGVPDGRRGTCRTCSKKWEARYSEANRDKVRERANRRRQAAPEMHREKSRQYHARNRDFLNERRRGRLKAAATELRDAVFEHYGRTCSCCGTTERLSIDHVNGDGGKHRVELFGSNANASSARMYRWLVESAFPAGFQTLCMSCNRSKGNGDRCRLDHGESG
jgi:hypothetical protein